MKKVPDSDPKQIRELIQQSLGLLSDAVSKQEKVGPEPYNENLPFGRYDLDLAEFPIFRFHKNELSNFDINTPLAYTDTIKGKDGEPVPRTWHVYPSRYGFGGASTMLLLYDLIQLYLEQGATGNQIQFGTLHSLFQRRGQRRPSERDYKRMMRDIDILRGLDFHAENAFWDKKTQAYVSLKWKLFNEVFYFRAKANSLQTELPFGFLEVSSTFREIARVRGFYSIGFQSELFYQLKPLEQRLALYLAKRFRSETLHQRFTDDLAQALPIEAKRPEDARKALKQAAQGLLDKHVPILASFRLEKARRGRHLAVFIRQSTPKEGPLPTEKREPLTPELQDLVSRLIAASGQPEDHRWWTQCARSLGRDGVFRAVGQFEEKRQLEHLHRPGAMLTAILKDIARQMKVSIQ
jgi:hypothetical protein